MQRAGGALASSAVAALVFLSAPGLSATASATDHAQRRVAAVAQPTRLPSGCDRTPAGKCRATAHTSSKDRDADRDDRRGDGDHDGDDHGREHDGGGGSGPCATTTGPPRTLTKVVAFNGRTYTADPGGLTVSPGTVVTVTIGAAPGTDARPTQLRDCLFVGHPETLGGADLGPTADKADSPPNALPFVTSFTVLGKWEGETICDRGKASGQATGDGGSLESNQFCFFVEPPAVVPEAPWPALFVILPVLAGGIAVVVRRRRRAALTG